MEWIEDKLKAYSPLGQLAVFTSFISVSKVKVNKILIITVYILRYEIQYS